MSHKREKLEQLAKMEGTSVMEMLNKYLKDSIVPGICMNPACSNTLDQLEPDQSSAPCEECGTFTIQSCLVIAGCI